VEDDNNPISVEIDERASDEDDLILHDPVKNTILMQAVDTLEQGLSKIKDENDCDTRRSHSKRMMMIKNCLTEKKHLKCNQCQSLMSTTLDQEEL
jgi:hypothetical protein